MKYLGLLLGSAAALVVVSGARAADAVIIPEPEPAEYVRVCDVFGSGFFYIPGTETCLRFDGYVRYSIDTSEDDDGWVKHTRVRLNVDARSETEFGMLRGFIRFQADWGNGLDDAIRVGDVSDVFDGNYTPSALSSDGPVGIDRAIVQIGGFYAGYTNSVFAEPWGIPGPAGAGGILQTDQAGMYADQQRHQLGYVFSAGNGFFGSVALEDDNDTGNNFSYVDPDTGDAVVVTDDGDGYMPDVTSIIGLNQGWGAVWAGIGYDESESAVGVRAGMQWDMPNSPDSAFRFGGWYASDPNAYAVEMPIEGLAEWSLAASYHQQFNPQWGVDIGAQYMSAFDEPTSGDDGSGYLVEASLVWEPVTNFDIRLEGHWYQQNDVVQADGSLSDDETWDGFLWFRRSF